MAAARSRTRVSGKMAGAERARRKAVSKPVIGDEERRHLIEACAFFHADHFRAVEPGTYRAQDVEDAAAEIDAVLKRGARKGRKT